MSIQPELVFHIGAAKCGSSAIQAFLRNNADAMAQRGVMVPDAKLDTGSERLGEQIWFVERMCAAEDGHGVLKRRIARLGGLTDDKAVDTVVISAENISNHHELATVFAEGAAGRRARVVFYVRRQDDYFLSAWQQWNLKRFDHLQDYLDARVGQDADWLRIIEPWADAFGDGSVRVRPFRRDRLVSGDVVADFFHTIHVDIDGLPPLSALANRSFNEHLADLLQRNRDLFAGPHDNMPFERVAAVLGEEAYKSGRGSHLMSLAQRQAIMARYEDSNEALKQRFLPRFGDAPLFEPPTEADVIPLDDVQRLERENAMLMRILYGLITRQTGS